MCGNLIRSRRLFVSAYMYLRNLNTPNPKSSPYTIYLAIYIHYYYNWYTLSGIGRSQIKHQSSVFGGPKKLFADTILLYYIHRGILIGFRVLYLIQCVRGNRVHITTHNPINIFRFCFWDIKLDINSYGL